MSTGVLVPLSDAVASGWVLLGSSSEIEPNVMYKTTRTSDAAQTVIGNSCHIAGGSIIHSGAMIGDDCQIGNHVVIEQNARIGARTKIEHGCVLGEGVQLGTDNTAHPQSVISGRVEIGDGNTIGPFAAIGAGPQHKGIPVSPGIIRIGNRNVLREFITVHLPTAELTEIGSNCYVMAYNHISHDTRIGDNVIMANNCQIGGHSHILRNANLGLSCVIHQFTVVGAGAMVGMGSILVKDVPPFVTFIAGAAVKLNRIGLERQGKTPTEIASLLKLYARAQTQTLPEIVGQGVGEWWHSDFEEFLRLNKRSISDYSRVGAGVEV